LIVIGWAAAMLGLVRLYLWAKRKDAQDAERREP